MQHLKLKCYANRLVLENESITETTAKKAKTIPMADGSTQTEGDRNKERSSNKSKAKILNEALGSNLDEDQLANLCMENLPGEVYTNTLV